MGTGGPSTLKTLTFANISKDAKMIYQANMEVFLKTSELKRLRFSSLMTLTIYELLCPLKTEQSVIGEPRKRNSSN